MDWTKTVMQLLNHIFLEKVRPTHPDVLPSPFEPLVSALLRPPHFCHECLQSCLGGEGVGANQHSMMAHCGERGGGEDLREHVA